MYRGRSTALGKEDPRLSLSLNTKEYQSGLDGRPDHLAEPAVPAWKMELNAKLAAHRQRQPAARGEAGESRPGSEAAGSERGGGGSTRAAMVAARVAERYAKAPSYSEFLAASAAAASAAAETAAFAARQAQDAAESFARLSGDRDAAEQARWDVPEVEARETEASPALAKPALLDESWVTVEHPQPLPARGSVPARQAGPSANGFGGGILDAFAEATVPPAVGLPAKLIEFPRELIAPRKSRPRIAEGPMAEASLFDLTDQTDHKDQTDTPSLRIFEVEGAEMAGEPGRELSEGSAALSGGSRDHLAGPRATHGADEASSSYAGRGAPEWQSIRLGEHPVSHSAGHDPQEPRGQTAGSDSQTDYRPEDAGQARPVLHTASLGDRALSALVDLAIVWASFLLFVVVFALCTAHPPLDKTALECGGVVLAGLFLFYHWLFMSYGGGTLGMRYAQIAICTFDDENPTRQVMRRRVAASLLSLLPLGLGFLWALFDEDGLGWHDRMTRSYQRSYR
jgi:uncharacterized RDD family membrane protein YckC